MEDIVWDLTSLTYQPATKSSTRSGHPKRHVIFAMSERKPAYPAHEDEDDKPLVRPTTRKEPLEEGRDQAVVRRRPCTSGSFETFETSWDRTTTEQNGTTNMAGSTCYTETKGVKGFARARRGGKARSQSEEVLRL